MCRITALGCVRRGRTCALGCVELCSALGCVELVLCIGCVKPVLSDACVELLLWDVYGGVELVLCVV
jgi:hypothetical protein